MYRSAVSPVQIGYDANDHPERTPRSGASRGRPCRLQRHGSGHDELADLDDADDRRRGNLRDGRRRERRGRLQRRRAALLRRILRADWQSYARANGYTTASWKYGLLDCLGKHNVSAACTASLDRREVLNAQMMAACGTSCRGTSPQPGAEPCVDHLKSIYDTLGNACREALDAHEAAKAVDGRCSLEER